MKRPLFQPFDFAQWEVFLMRLFFAAVVWVEIKEPIYVEGQPEPVGLARFADLTFLADPATATAVHWTVAAALAFYVWGRGVAIALPVATLAYAAYGALINSQGAAKHHLQIIGLVLLAQCLYYVWNSVANRLRVDPDSDATRRRTHARAAWIAMQTVAATYFVTFLTKVINSGGEWVKQAKYFPLQLIKTERSDYYNTLDNPAIDPVTSAITRLLMESPNLCRTILGAGLLLELCVVLALLGRKWALAIGLLTIAFHLTISKIMALDFQLNVLTLAIFFVNAPFWLYLATRHASPSSQAPQPQT